LQLLDQTARLIACLPFVDYTLCYGLPDIRSSTLLVVVTGTTTTAPVPRLPR